MISTVPSASVEACEISRQVERLTEKQGLMIELFVFVHRESRWRTQSGTEGNVDGDGGAFSILAFERNVPAMDFDEPPCHGQAEPGALLLIDLSLKLHVGTDVDELLRGQSTPLVDDPENKFIVG